MKRGSRVQLIDVPKCCMEDLNKIGTVTRFWKDINGTEAADVILDGEDGPSAVYVRQLKEV